MRRRTFVGSAAAALAAASFPFARGIAAQTFKSVPAEVPAVTGTGKQVLLTSAEVQELRSSLRGSLLLRADEEYDTARQIWNASIDRRPALIARCADSADVAASVQFARAHDLLVAVRCGGHSSSGQSVCEGGLMIDLSPLRSVTIDPAARVARVEGGCLLGDFDREAQAFGLATTTGTVSHTGVGGLTLGGGIGHLARKHGMSIDNLLGVDIVTASGMLVRASADENEDLFWGVRGGGGNFGVVTSFEFQLHEIGRSLIAGHLLYPWPLARKVLAFLPDYAAELPDEASISPTLISAPDNVRLVDLAFEHLGTPEEAERLVAPLRALAKPMMDSVGPMPYLKWQSEADGSLRTPGSYLKAGFVRRFDSALTDALIASIEGASLPIAQVVSLAHLGGAVSRIAPSATAFPHRDALMAVLLIANWHEPGQAPPAMSWARTAWKSVEPSTRGVYSNFLSPDDTQQRVRESYGANLERLVHLKKKYDSTNLFRMNANIPPSLA